jgi:hypothetical protein
MAIKSFCSLVVASCLSAATNGKLADMIILSRDIFQINPFEIERTKVRLASTDGRVVYEEKNQPEAEEWN